MHFYRVPEAFGLIISQAFDFNAVGCGVMGFGIGAALKKGLARGVFSNEAGLGSSVIAHSASELREPVRQGMWGIFEVFFDTFVICTLTALMFLTTNDVSALSPDMDDSVLSVGMFSANFGGFGVLAFSLILPLFAFTSIIAWSYYGEKAVGFLSGKRSKYLFRGRDPAADQPKHPVGRSLRGAERGSALPTAAAERTARGIF